MRLAEIQITNVLLEGGAEVYTSALNQGLVDKLTFFYAPRFLGKDGGPDAAPRSTACRQSRTIR